MSFATLDWSAVESSRIKTSSSANAIKIGTTENFVNLDTTGAGQLHVSFDTVLLGDSSEFTLSRPAHESSAGESTVIIGQNASGTNQPGGDLRLSGGAGSPDDGAGGHVIIQGGAGAGLGPSGNVYINNDAGERKLELNSFEDVLAIYTSELKMSGQPTNITTAVSENALVIGVHPNVVIFDTTGNGTIDVHFSDLDVSSQDWTIQTATSSHALTVGTSKSSLVLDTEKGAIRLEQISNIDVSSSSTTISLGLSSSAFSFVNGTDSDLLVMNTLDVGKLSLKFGIIDMSSVDKIEILSADTMSFIVNGNQESVWNMKTDDSIDILNINSKDKSVQLFYDTLELGTDKRDSSGFTIKRPPQKEVGGTPLNILGQDAFGGFVGQNKLNGGDINIIAGTGGENGNGGSLVLRAGRAGDSQGDHGGIKLQDGSGETKLQISTDSTMIKTAKLDLSGQSTVIEIEDSVDRGFTIKSNEVEYLSIGNYNMHLCPHCTFITFGNETGDKAFALNRPPSQSGAGNAFIMRGQAGYNGGKGGSVEIYGGNGGDNTGVGGNVDIYPGRNGLLQGEDSGSVNLFGCTGMDQTKFECFERVSVHRESLRVSANTILTKQSFSSSSISLSQKPTSYIVLLANAPSSVTLSDATDGQILFLKNLGRSRTVNGIQFQDDDLKLLLFNGVNWEQLAGSSSRRRTLYHKTTNPSSEIRNDSNSAAREIEFLKMKINALQNTIGKLSDSSSMKGIGPGQIWIVSPLSLSILALITSLMALIMSFFSTRSHKFGHNSAESKDRMEGRFAEMQKELARLQGDLAAMHRVCSENSSTDLLLAQNIETKKYIGKTNLV